MTKSIKKSFDSLEMVYKIRVWSDATNDDEREVFVLNLSLEVFVVKAD